MSTIIAMPDDGLSPVPPLRSHSGGSPPTSFSDSSRTEQPHHQQQQFLTGHRPRRADPPCQWLVRALKWLPVLFIVSIIGWSYYAYVVQLCILAVNNVVERIFYLLFFHVVFVMFFWSYWQTVFTPVASVPAVFHLPAAECQRILRAENVESYRRVLDQFAKDLPIQNRAINGSVRFCEKCLLVKPDRAHHCSVCGQCVLKMDHHCPWVNNCVNFANYKYFVLFLGYALVYCVYVALTTLHYFVLFWEGTLTGGMGRFHILFLFFVSVMFSLSVVSLFGYHLYLVALNRTTLESFRAAVFRVGGPDKNGFHLGCYANLQEVFGKDRWMWLVPLPSSVGNGIEYPLPERLAQTLDAMATTGAQQRPPAGNSARPASGQRTLDETSLSNSPTDSSAPATNGADDMAERVTLTTPIQRR